MLKIAYLSFESQEPHRVYPSIPAELRRPIKVLSLFDGIATGWFIESWPLYTDALIQGLWSLVYTVHQAEIQPVCLEGEVETLEVPAGCWTCRTSQCVTYFWLSAQQGVREGVNQKRPLQNHVYKLQTACEPQLKQAWLLPEPKAQFESKELRTTSSYIKRTQIMPGQIMKGLCLTMDGNAHWICNMEMMARKGGKQKLPMIMCQCFCINVSWRNDVTYIQLRGKSTAVILQYIIYSKV